LLSGPDPRDRLRIIALSDTHNLHRSISSLFQGDLLIHAGDFSFFFEDMSAIRDFNAWLGELRFRHKIVVPGNHERIMYERPELRRLITNATLLVNESVTIEGVKLWGSPVTCDDEAFGCSSAEERRTLYASIPQGTDILITHCPPHGVLDVEFRSGGLHRGCPELLAAVQRVKPQVHIFGHVHSSRGAQRVGETTFINAALLGWSGDLENRPITFEFPLRKKEEK
jgi:Icc-related predicted phosphoesterase